MRLSSLGERLSTVSATRKADARHRERAVERLQKAFEALGKRARGKELASHCGLARKN